MAFETKNLEGALFKNDRDSDDDKAPAYKGRLVVDGRLFFVSGWVNTPRNGGAKYLKLKLTEDEKSARQNSQRPSDEHRSGSRDSNGGRGSDSRSSDSRGSTRRQQEVDDEIPF